MESLHLARPREGRGLREGATLLWTFNAIKPVYPYKLPARAEIVEFEARDRVTWEATAPGFHALHSYRFAAAAPSAAGSGRGRSPRGLPTARCADSGSRISGTCVVPPSTVRRHSRPAGKVPDTSLYVVA